MKRDNNKGFSLVELLVALAIASIVLLALTMFISGSVTSFRKQTTLAQLQNDADNTLNQLETDIIQTQRLEIETVEDATTGTNASATIVLRSKIEKKNASTNNMDVTYSDFGYRYSKAEKTIYMNNGTSDSVVCQNVVDFKIEEVGVSGSAADKKNYGVKLTIKLSLANEEREVTRVVYTRNQILDSMYKFEKK